ncbi:MAG: hypothetical protein A3H52_00260 [Candidatus Zambryskibacteria bacterium RIFCSPLOWO2_02_FULL_39_26]|uniref:Transposase IS200-like domain-containing protein n=1 Tax=Candidatus Zambryskibacteria bacterium RIFCSPLOWO2_12_FULL_39_23 TaxID=1802776 RepID=A0A1G2URY7_9BACT|nr:MAG: hypothetical protein A2W51_01430 [Candidatus Zambryskibacteria bacterium RIFCSPHIGHO2_02_39_10]OHB00156.1 MAG: hypothetical protein A3E59_02135 [Candidatus Zambryskibacteria bacterium RIFCSPHIGHO2_12_FULL_39_47]OHB09785.1 MAG: hypothetical protein A3H52_00260 [Candidatus Zambryskibacteria bacterium RIFCSPLOWO2_02_FULL_39_26]OHB12157.1 MAG: hypothetical protein A3G99_00790 [Candidatus Zambryskibacteria bacterium RIFCSPLOWO2_12_FULL_39_23]
MTYRKEALVEGEYYHIYNRGNSKQNIFTDDLDRDRFTKLLYLCNSEKSINFRDDIVGKKIDAFDFNRGEELVSIGAWVLMPNHFHLYISPRRRLGDLGEETNSISVFVQKLCTSYSMYFNKKYKRTGKLFEGPFKAVHTKNDVQSKYIFSYIHLNPLKLIDPLWKEKEIRNVKKSIEFLNKYEWSSYLDFRKIKRLRGRILNLKVFPQYFLDKEIFDKEIFDWVTFNK